MSHKWAYASIQNRRGAKKVCPLCAKTVSINDSRTSSGGIEAIEYHTQCWNLNAQQADYGLGDVDHGVSFEYDTPVPYVDPNETLDF